MKIRIYNARILTMETERPIFRGELHVEEDKITYVGEGPCEVTDGWDREIDACGNLLMPGFKNAHAHTAMTFLRSYAEDVPLQEWLFEKIFPMEDKLTRDHIYHLTKLGNLEYLTSGITASADMYLNREAQAQACVDTGFRSVLIGAVSGAASNVEKLESDYLQFNHFHPLISYQMGIHAEYTCSRELMEAAAAMSHKYKAPMFCHNSETASEVAGCVERYGTTPTAFLNQIGFYDYGGGGYHCVHMSEEDLDIFQQRGLYAVTNPASNLKLASGIAPVRTMLERRIPMAIGTDGPSSNNCLDMFREMFLVAALAKVREQDAAAVDTLSVLKMATVGGADAMGLKDCDVLAAGKQADLIMIDLHQPNMQPIHDIPKNLVYSGSKSNVKLTMIAGRILYEQGEFFVGEDVEEIYAKANEIVQELTGRSIS